MSKVADQEVVYRAYVPEVDREEAALHREYVERLTRSMHKHIGDVSGPPIALPAGALYATRNRREFIEDFMLRRAEPVDPPVRETAEYIVTRFHRVVREGKFVDLHPTDIYRMTRSEALPLLRAMVIKSINKDDFNL